MAVSPLRGVPRMKLLCALVASCFAADGLANPTGPAVVSGTAAFSSVGKALTVTSSPNAIINWQGFSIGAGELTRFQQQSASSAVLNRVVGQDPSAILGTLSSNGRVFLVNPNGILFGLGSRVDVGGLVASTLNITNQDFLAGKLNFQAGAIANPVVNRGEIVTSSGGRVLLLAPDVQNHGLISSPSGEVLLAAGKSVQLVDPDVPQLKVEVQAGGEVLNVGQIFAESGKIGVYAGLIRHSGVARADSVAVGPGGAIQFRASGNVSLEAGSELSARGAERGGTIAVSGDVVLNSGRISADGASGGTIGIAGRNYLGAGSASADGSTGNGGSVSVSVTGGVIATAAERLSARGAQEGGSVSVSAGVELFSSGTLDASGGRGGTISVLAPQVRLYGATLDASGDTGGGTILVGGDYKGGNPAVPNATSTWVNYSTKIRADAGQSGNGGKVIVWADNDTRYGGDISVRGGAVSGDGGFVEVSGKNDLAFVGTVNASAQNGTAGSVLLDPKNIIIDAAASGVAAFQLVDPNQGTGQQFPGAVAALSNGNVVATDPDDNFAASAAGAVYLFNGTTGALVSTLIGSASSDRVGSGGITTLTGNSNFVVRSPQWFNSGTTTAGRGAVTWMSGTSSSSITVGSGNSLVGTANGDRVGNGGITALTNGNYVVSSSNWLNGTATFAGAATWGNGATGISGPVSAANSLVGTTSSDNVGAGGITALTNGNYLVSSTTWSVPSGAASVGAVTWGSGTGGTSGAVSTANSLVGSTASDRVGLGGVVALNNGNAVVASPNWDGLGVPALAKGAVTWMNGTAATVTGAVSVGNSLTGGLAGDRVGLFGVVALTNGNYVAVSPNWIGVVSVSSAGAVTWGSGTGGTTGLVSSGNSLVGSSANDMVGSGGVIALTNGNYAVSSPNWANTVTAAAAGAVTWASGTGGTTGAVSAANSLVGSAQSDKVGGGSNGGVVALTNGNFVVASPDWGSNATAFSGEGAVSWMSGTAATTGAVSSANSLVGTASGQRLGSGGVAALTNGHYVISSPNWSNGTALPSVGAVTWGNGTAGVVGTVSTANSLVGSTSSDSVGSGGVTALTNGNYVVASPNWVDGSLTAVGAVTWGNGTAGTVGTVAPGNSLIGSSNNDRVGNEGVIALTNGNYVVKSGAWSGDKGAATFRNGATATAGVVSSANSLVGTIADDLKSGLCSECEVTVVALPNGNYVVVSDNWSNGTATQVGAVTWGSGTIGVAGTVSAVNSLIGSTANDRVGSGGVTALGANNFLVSSPSFTQQGTLGAAGALHVVPPTGITNPLLFSDNPSGTTTLSPVSITALTNQGTTVTLQANNDITLNASSPIITSAGGAGGAITMQAGRSVVLNSNITTDNGNLTITANDPTAQAANRDPGPGTLTMAAGTTLDAGTGTVALTVGAGVAGATSGNLVVENIIAANVNLQQQGATSGSSILRSTASSLITATNLLIESDLVGAASSSSIGTAGSPMRVQVSNLEAHTHEASPGIFVSSPSQGLTIGGVPFTGTIKGVQALAGGDVSIAANGPITVLAASPILTTSGNVSLTGNATINLAAPVSAGGNVTIDAQGATSNVDVTANITGTAAGASTVQITAGNTIALTSGADITATGGALGITLHSDSDASGAGRIALGPGTVLTSNGGNVTLGGGADPTTGYAVGDGAGGGAQHGVRLNGASILAGAGNVSIRGQGAAGTTIAEGVRLDNSAVVSTTTGSITLTGIGGAGALGGSNRGIHLTGTGTTISSVDGAISFTGTGGSSTGSSGLDVDGLPTDGNNRGILINDGPVIQTTGLGNIVMTGTGDTSVDRGQNTGVLISQDTAIGTRVTTVNGNITITGIAGGTTGAGATIGANRGVSIGSAEIRATGTGAISITGTGGTSVNSTSTSTNSGVLIQGDPDVAEVFVTTAGGALSVTGTAGSTSGAGVAHEGIAIVNDATVQATGGALALTGTASAGNPAIRIDAVGGSLNPAHARAEGATLTVTANGLLKLAGATGTNEFAELVSSGNQSITATGIVLTGGASGTGNYAEIGAGGNQSVTVGASGISLTGGSAGSDNSAQIATLGTQTINSADITLTGGEGFLNFARLIQFGSSGPQTIAATGAITMIAGGITSSGSRNYAQIEQRGNALQHVTADSIRLEAGGGASGDRNSAAIFTSAGSTASQQVDIGPGGLTMIGGTGSGGENKAGIWVLADQTTDSGTVATQAVNVSGGGSITITGGSNALNSPSGNNNNAGIYAEATGAGSAQTVTVTGTGGIDLTGGASGVSNHANIWSVTPSQTISAGSGGITLQGDGGATGRNDKAFIYQEYATGSQSITVNGGGSILAMGGTGSGGQNFGQILNDGSGLQSITFTAPGSTIILHGGTGDIVTPASSGNGAFIDAAVGNQTIAGNSLANNPGITLVGGNSGGNTGGSASSSLGNNVLIRALLGTQNISAGSILVNAGLAGVDNSASIQAPAQTITASSVTIGGGGGSGTFGGARIGGIGGTAPGPTNLSMTTTGDVTVSGGSVSGASIGSNAAGGVSTAITITSTGGSVILNPGGVGARIGSPASNIAGGDISITAAGTIALNSSAGVGTAIRTLGNVTLSAASITQGADSVIIAGGSTTLNGGAISLTSASNDFTGAVTLNSGGANNVAITDANAIVLGSSSLGTGELDVSAGGSITQTGPIVQAPGAGQATFSAGSNAITLTNAGNDFTGPVDLDTTGTAAITDANSFIIQGGGGVGGNPASLTINANGTVSQSATFTGTAPAVIAINAGSGPIQLNDPANNFSGNVSVAANTTGAASLTNTNAGGINLAASSVGGALSLTSGGPVTQAGAIAVGGTSTLNAGANPITLANSGNDFTGAVSLNNSGANNASITDANAIVLGTSSVGSGTLTVNASGAITQTGAITQAAGAGAASFNAGANPITLTNTANDFTGVVNLTGTNVSITDANTLTLGVVNASSLTVNASTINQDSSGVVVSGTTALNAGSVALTTATNDFGTVALSTTGTVAITDQSAINFGASTLGTGSLAVSASGAITQTGAMTQAAGAGGASFNAGSNPISLTNASNDFTGAVSLTGTNVSITDANTLTLGAVSASNLTLNGSAIDQNASGVVVGGTSTLTANTITLNSATNDFGTVAVSSPGNVSLTDANAISIGNASVGGAFDITAASTSFLSGFSANNYSFSGGSYTLAAGTYNLGGTTTIASSAAVTASGATINAAGGTMNVSGTFSVLGGSVNVGTLNVLAGGVLTGTATIVGNVNNSAGTVSPGASPGILTINGNYVQGPSGTLAMDIGGLNPGTDYDQLIVSGNASLGGALNASLIGGFVPPPGSTYTFIQAAGGVSGTFSTINQPVGALFDTFYGPTTFEFIAAGVGGGVPAPIEPSFNQSIVSIEQVLDVLLGVGGAVQDVLFGAGVVASTTTTTPEGKIVPKPPACN